MIPILIYLLIVTVLGAVLYVYLRQEQNKIISKDKYDEAWNEAFYKRETKNILVLPSRLISRLIVASIFIGLSGLGIILRFSAFGWFIIFFGIFILGFAVVHMVIGTIFIFMMDLDDIFNYSLLFIVTLAYYGGLLFQVDGDGSNSSTVLQYLFIPNRNSFTDSLAVYSSSLMCFSIILAALIDGFIFMSILDKKKRTHTKIDPILK